MKNESVQFDVIIIGAGAAGLMCAIEAGKRARNVLVLERAERVGKKILISGGGRCNFTNLEVTPKNYVSENPHFCISALKRFSPQDFLKLVQKHHIAFHEKKLGQLFCDESSKQILNCLLAECEAACVHIKTSCAISSLEKTENGFLVVTNQGNYNCESLVIATGGISYPKLGATDFGYQVAKQFGLGVINPEPALVPFVFNQRDSNDFCDLAGVSCRAGVRVGKIKITEDMLITHKGLSGPAILQISNYWHGGDEIVIDFLPDLKDATTYFAAQKEAHPKAFFKSILAQHLPVRLAERLCSLENHLVNLSESKPKERADFVHKLKNWKFVPLKTEGFDRAEVTRGGVDTADLSSQTMAVKKNPNLYFIGEVVDVTGQLGGFNFQWAWASGVAAGQVA